jgi:hypothetical protein
MISAKLIVVIFSERGIFQRKFICRLIERFAVQLMMIFDCSESEKMRIAV